MHTNNYFFNFDLDHAKILLYKLSNSTKPTNYFQLSKGSFVLDIESIMKLEQGMKKKKNYIPLPNVRLN